MPRTLDELQEGDTVEFVGADPALRGSIGEIDQITNSGCYVEVEDEDGRRGVVFAPRECWRNLQNGDYGFQHEEPT